MNKGQLKKALQAHKERERAKKADGLTVKGYPYSHNPYLAHELVEDCYPGCVLMSHVHDFEPDGRCACGEHVAMVPYLLPVEGEKS